MSTTPHVILISFTYRPVARVVRYAQFLVEHGLDVDVVLWDVERWRELEPQFPDEARVFEVRHAESRIFLRRLENLLVFRIPGGILARTRKLADTNPVTRPVGHAVGFAQRVHGKLAGVFHGRVFVPFYRTVRPYLLARATGKLLRDVEHGPVDRIVAADPYAITYAWHLARRWPEAHAVTHMDRQPYLTAAEQKAATQTQAA